jgi:hypothetical protein
LEAVASLLEGRGLPKIGGLVGGRYVRPGKAFFDREYGIHEADQVSAQHISVNRKAAGL